jgi:hypothetical protein
MDISPAIRRQLVSCSVERIYGQGGFQESAAQLLELRESSLNAHRAIEVVAELYPPFAYRRNDPTVVHADPAFRRELLDHYHWINTQYPQGPSSLLAKLSAAAICGTVLHAQVDGETRIVYETYRAPDRPDSKLLQDESSIERYPGAPQSLCFFLGSVGSLNYGHWLVDDFPRLAAIAHLRRQFPTRHIEIVLPSYAHIVGKKRSDRWNGVRRQSLRCALRGIRNVSCTFLESNRAYRFETLFYATPATYHPILKSRHALEYTAAKHLAGRRWWDRLRRTHRRLLVVRRQARGRVLHNLAVVEARLERQGFHVVDTESLSVMQQAGLFAGADIVVGIMGAAMTNTIFCRSGARIMHLAPQGWLEPFYWDLASVCGHDYSAYFGATGDTEAAPHTRGFTLSTDAIESLCAAVSRE